MFFNIPWAQIIFGAGHLKSDGWWRFREGVKNVQPGVAKNLIELPLVPISVQPPFN